MEAPDHPMQWLAIWIEVAISVFALPALLGNLFGGRFAAFWFELLVYAVVSAPQLWMYFLPEDAYQAIFEHGVSDETE